jgi:tetratricopeptide (TPR) repeat protein
MLMLRFRASKEVSIDEHLQCIDDMQKFYPQDGAVAFMMVDAYLHRQQPDEALKCLDRVIGSIGPDSALLARRANVLLAMKDLVAARKVLDEAIALEPDLRDPYVVSLDVVLAAKDFDATASLLTLLTDKFGYQWKDLEQVAPFAEFVDSTQYRKWLETRKK